MIYSYQSKNTFKHLLLDPAFGLHQRHPSTFLRYHEQVQWVKEIIGKRNIKWTITYGYLCNGKKVYDREVPTHNLWRAREIDHVLQWCFYDKADAMAFKLRWM